MPYRTPFKRSSSSKSVIHFCLTSALLLSLTACQLNPLKTTAEVIPQHYSQAQQSLAQQQAKTLFQQYYQHQLDSSPVLRSSLAIP
jgi:hypothetical protein